jgi:carbonic anhydrase
MHSPIVQRAWDRGQPLSVHGWVYGLANGLLKDLECGGSHP